MIDQMRLLQILLNLLTNAIKFSSQNSKVILQAKYSRVNPSQPHKYRIQVDVIDNGIGITEND